MTSPLRRLHLRAAREADLRVPALLSKLRRRWLLLRHPNVELDIHPTVQIGPGFRLVAPHGGRVVVGPFVEFRRGCLLELGPGAEVVIGERAKFTHSALIQITTRLEVGAGAGLGQGTAIFDGRHGWDDTSKRWYEQDYLFNAIRIGEDCAIHSKCTITASIGDRTVVGANAVVNRDLPADVMAGGVPAKVIRPLGAPEAATVGDREG